jgi:hypothetical protein
VTGVEHAHVVGVVDGEELHKRKFTGELATHLDRNILISRAMKDSDARFRVVPGDSGKIFPVILVFAE